MNEGSEQLKESENDILIFNHVSKEWDSLKGFHDYFNANDIRTLLSGRIVSHPSGSKYKINRFPYPATVLGQDRQPCKYVAGNYCDVCKDASCDFYLEEQIRKIHENMKKEQDDQLFRIERLAYECILNHPESKGFCSEIKEIAASLRSKP